MTQPIHITGTIQMPVPAIQPIQPIQPPPPQPPAMQCFLCLREGRWALALTVYKGTHLCAQCVKDLPSTFIVDEFPPSTTTLTGP